MREWRSELEMQMPHYLLSVRLIAKTHFAPQIKVLLIEKNRCINNHWSHASQYSQQMHLLWRLQGMEADKPIGPTSKILWKQQPPLYYTALLSQQLFSWQLKRQGIDIKLRKSAQTYSNPFKTICNPFRFTLHSSSTLRLLYMIIKACISTHVFQSVYPQVFCSCLHEI